jgi:hypothetical protein
LLGGVGGARGVVASQLLDLLGLLIDDLGGLDDLCVDDFLVGLVGEGGEENDGGRNQSETPEWNDLDEVVGDEGAEESLGRLACNREMDRESLQLRMQAHSQRRQFVGIQ